MSLQIRDGIFHLSGVLAPGIVTQTALADYSTGKQGAVVTSQPLIAACNPNCATWLGTGLALLLLLGLLVATIWRLKRQNKILHGMKKHVESQSEVGSFQEISQRIRTDDERDRLFNLSVDLLSVGDLDGFLQQVNPAWVRVLGWSRDDLKTEPLPDFIHAEDQDLFCQGMKRLQEGELVEDLQCRFRCRDNTYKWLSWSSFPYPEKSQVFSVVRDITSQKEAQLQLSETQNRLRSLNNQLSLVEDRQRRQLAEAIHDGLAQQLFGLRAMVTLLHYPDKLDDLQKVVTEIINILDDTMTEARSLSFELFPPELQDVGLEAALASMAEEFQERTGIQCEVAAQEEVELSEDLRAMAYQSVRELFNNVKKHASADEIKVSFNQADRYLTILVSDNGRGFELFAEGSDESSRLEHEGFGLFNIRERIRSVDGRMLVDSRPGQGCRVFLSYPLDQSVS
ncbi:MAG: PAS domain-containing sensor histidine kinase [Gemmatimonadales bacterium]|nr:PAS domain-containing sensor histidine kinase [Gemmatimonadales bacterium]